MVKLLSRVEFGFSRRQGIFAASPRQSLAMGLVGSLTRPGGGSPITMPPSLPGEGEGMSFLWMRFRPERPLTLGSAVRCQPASLSPV